MAPGTCGCCGPWEVPSTSTPLSSLFLFLLAYCCCFHNNHIIIPRFVKTQLHFSTIQNIDTAKPLCKEKCLLEVFSQSKTLTSVNCKPDGAEAAKCRLMRNQDAVYSHKSRLLDGWRCQLQLHHGSIQPVELKPWLLSALQHCEFVIQIVDFMARENV